jgi:hypothetical protein
VPYWVYLNTDHWFLTKEMFKEQLRDSGPLTCARCGIQRVGTVEMEEDYWVDERGNECSRNMGGAEKRLRVWKTPREPQWDVHHLTYERLGCEEFEDLELLCCMCHNLEHYPESHAAKNWKEHLYRQALAARLEQGV